MLGWCRELVGDEMDAVRGAVDSSSGELSVVVGHPLADEFLEFCRARCRPNTRVALAWDLEAFFVFVDKTPTRALRPRCTRVCPKAHDQCLIALVRGSGATV